MRNRIYLLAFSFVLLVISFSCKKKTMYEKNYEIKNAIWYRLQDNNLLRFNVPVKNTEKYYNIFITIQYRNNIDLRSLRLGLNVITPDDSEKYSMHDIFLKNENGEYIGEIEGDIWKLKHLILKNYKFNIKGNFIFDLENLMSKYEIKGIEQVGLIIEESQEKIKE